MRCALFWAITHHTATIPDRRFGINGLLGLLGHYPLRKIPVENRSHLHRGRNPKSHLICPIMQILVAISPESPCTILTDISEDSENIGIHWDIDYKKMIYKCILRK
jgi:hypothetical protein